MWSILSVGKNEMGCRPKWAGHPGRSRRSEGEASDKLAVTRLREQARIVDCAESRRRCASGVAAIRASRDGAVRATPGSLRARDRGIVQLQAVEHVEELGADLERHALFDSEGSADVDRFGGTPGVPVIRIVRRCGSKLPGRRIDPRGGIQDEVTGWVNTVAVWVLEEQRLAGNPVLRRRVTVPIGLVIGRNGNRNGKSRRILKQPANVPSSYHGLQKLVGDAVLLGLVTEPGVEEERLVRAGDAAGVRSVEDVVDGRVGRGRGNVECRRGVRLRLGPGESGRQRKAMRIPLADFCLKR